MPNLEAGPDHQPQSFMCRAESALLHHVFQSVTLFVEVYMGTSLFVTGGHRCTQKYLSF